MTENELIEFVKEIINTTGKTEEELSNLINILSKNVSHSVSCDLISRDDLSTDKIEYFAHETAVIDDGCTIGKDTKIWHFSHIMTGCIIGERCNIGQNVVVSPQVILGNHVKVQNNVSIYTGITCEDDVFIGPSCVFTNIRNPRSAVSRKDQYLKTPVGKGATIGANATIICGNPIGAYAFIGAGSTLTKEALPYSLWTGNPARQTGWVSEYGHRLVFDKQNTAVCPETGERYVLKNNQVFKNND